MSMVRGKARKRALAALNYDLFQSTWVEQAIAPEPQEAPRLKTEDGQLPSVEELHRLFDRFNWIHFDGRLPRVGIEYSTRMTAAGSYTPQRRLIKIGRKYHELFPEEIKDTLKHEMIHIVHFRHNSQFKAEAERIGASMRAKSHPQLKRPPRYLYECPGCGREYPRQKRLRMASCGYCSDRGKFDSRFKLKLKKSARQG
ncbi:MAG: SprT-like domain-containing protein [candidate division Zixibacteria bacterium]|nr:SprT-like domain-containing protein [candidate division Zixibacteria bacterium]